jgi:acyl-CoA synthetase (AMP-forming)/AMP-acid ligase II
MLCIDILQFWLGPVVAKPEIKWGESPLAFVEVKPDTGITAADLIAHCKTLLAGNKVPKEIRFEEQYVTESKPISKQLTIAPENPKTPNTFTEYKCMKIN